MAVRDAAPAGVALGRGDARLRHRHHHVGRDRRLLGQQFTHALAGGVHGLAVELAVGAGEVHELEEAELRLDAVGRERVEAAHAGGVDDDHLAGRELPHEVGADDVQRGRLRRHDPAVVEPAEAERPEAVGVAYADDVRVVHQDERERALEHREHVEESPLEVAAVAPQALAGPDDRGRAQLGDHVRIARDRAVEHAGAGNELGGVGEVAVVAEGEAGVADRAVDRLGVAPRARAGGRVAGVADGQMADQRCQRPLVEHVGDQAHVLDHHDRVAVADRHPRRLLAAVLQRVQPGVGQMGDGMRRCVHAEDTACLLGRISVPGGLLHHADHLRTPRAAFFGGCRLGVS